MKEFTLKTHRAEDGQMVKLPIEKITVDKDEKTGKHILLLLLCFNSKVDRDKIISRLEMIQLACNLERNASESELYVLAKHDDQQIQVTGNLSSAITHLQISKYLHSEDEKIINDDLASHCRDSAVFNFSCK